MPSDIVFQDLETISNMIKDDAKILEGKTLLISGGSGFIGSYFVATINYLNKKFLSKPCKVVSLDNYITGIEKNIFGLTKDENILFVKHDVREPLKIEQKIDYVVHAAGIGSPIYYRQHPIETIEVGTLGTKNMLEVARQNNAASFLFFSSSEVYGNPDPKFVPTPETYLGNVSCTGARACYDESKRLGETLCINYFKIYNVPVKIVRPFNIYGPGMKLNDYRVIPNFFANAFNKESLPIYGDGRQTRTFCYITDAIIAFFKILLSKNSGEVYNAGNDKEEIGMMGEKPDEMIRRPFHWTDGIRGGFSTYSQVHAKAHPQQVPRRGPDYRRPASSSTYSSFHRGWRQRQSDHPVIQLCAWVNHFLTRVG